MLMVRALQAFRETKVQWNRTNSALGQWDDTLIWKALRVWHTLPGLEEERCPELRDPLRVTPSVQLKGARFTLYDEFVGAAERKPRSSQVIRSEEDIWCLVERVEVSHQSEAIFVKRSGHQH